jgi:hypothetical protein
VLCEKRVGMLVDVANGSGIEVRTVLELELELEVGYE